jgi:RecB family exonuclease
MDAVYRHEDGTIELVDFKTSRAPNEPELFLPVDTAVQMAAYGLLALDAWGVTVDQLRTTICYLGGDEPVLHTTIWDEHTAMQQREIVRAQIVKVGTGSTAVIPGAACSHCDFSAFCEGAAQMRSR